MKRKISKSKTKKTRQPKLKVYKKTHESKKVAKIHSQRIKARGGVVTQKIKDGKTTLEYYFPEK